MIFVFDRVENIVGKGENVVASIFLFPTCFQKTSFSGSLKLGLCGKERQKCRLLQIQSICR